ncbi:hypothetical protein BD770DRAFT_442467 [Pilaira anomala]|nr:hypothetical protein BD770DRAFT_442467 [Pilaira anomala]
MVFGTDEPETFDSWCPDCVITNSIDRKAIQVKNYILVEAAAGGRSERKENAANHYRVFYNFHIFNFFAVVAVALNDLLVLVIISVEDDCADYNKLIKFVES